MLYEVTQMFAIRKFPCAGHGKNIRIVFGCNQVQSGVSSKAGIGDHHDLLHPCWRHTVLEHLPQEDVLMPCDLGVNRGKGHWDTHTAPTRDEQDHRERNDDRDQSTWEWGQQMAS